MFLPLFLLAAAAAHPLEGLRLTQMQMFQLQLPYRYRVSIAEIGRDGLGRWELQVSEYYCNSLRRLDVTVEPSLIGPPSPLRRAVVRGKIILELDDILSFPDDRYSHLDGFILIAEGEYLLVVFDRLEKKNLWPLEK